MNGVRQQRKTTNKVMTYKQRLVLEALRTIGEGSLTDIAFEMDRTRGCTKHVVPALMLQGYIVQTKKKESLGKGCSPARYMWSGKTFPPAIELVPRTHPSEPPPAIAVLVASMYAMVHSGRVPA